jgi:hypothetical protein
LQQTPNINTLVGDIYGLFTDETFTPSSDQVETFGRRLAEKVSGRIGERQSASTLRLSNLGTPCNRKLWYSVNTPESGEKLGPDVKIKFLFGDILEELLLFLAEQAGHKVEGQQDELDLHGVKGHRDAVIDGVLVDVKSASSYSFSKFDKHLLPADDSFGYTTQIDAYLEASQGDERLAEKQSASFLVIDKTLGKICLDTHEKRNVDYETLVSEKREMLSNDSPPPRGYADEPEGKSGNRKLGTVCSYCNFKYTCYPLLRGFAYAGRPVFLTKVVREPNVPEIKRR